MTDGQEWAAPDAGGSPGSGAAPPPGPQPPPGPTPPPGAGPDAAAPDPQPPPFAAPGGTPAAPFATPGQYGPPPGPMPPQAPKPGIIPLRPLNVSELLDGAITYMRRNPRAVIGLSLIVSLVSQAIIFAVSYVSLGDMMRTSMNPATAADPDALSPGALLAPYATLVPALIVTSFAILVLAGMLTTVVGRAVLGGSSSIGRAWRDVRPRLPALLATALVTLVLTALAMALPLVPVVLLVIADAPPAASVAAGLLGALVAVAAAVWIFVSYAFATPAVVLEGTGVLGALARSYRLIKTAWWRTFGLLLLAQLIAGLIGGAVQTPFSIAGFVILFTSGPDVSDATIAAYLALAAIGGIVAGTLTYPFSAGVTTLLYVDRRMRREGLDLELQTTSARYADTDLSKQELVEVWRPSHAATGAAPPAMPGGPPGTVPETPPTMPGTAPGTQPPPTAPYETPYETPPPGRGQ